MRKELIIIIGLFLLLFGLIISSDSDAKKKIIWKQSYLRKHKIPYGTYVAYNELQSLFPSAKIKPVNQSPYSFLKYSDISGTYIFVNKNIKLGEEELEQLQGFVAEGNDVFISSRSITFDSLGFSTDFLVTKSFGTKKHLKLINENFGYKDYFFNRSFAPIIFDKIDTQKTTVLGYLEFDSEIDSIEKGINFVKFKYGSGNFYLHTFPEAFTNNFILDSINSEYTAGLLTYLGQPKDLFWDAYYKEGREKISSPLFYVFNNRSLKWAYYMLILGILLFIVFEAKRKQKAIPIIKPEENMSLQFTQTIANLYYETSNHKKISDMMINFFMDNIRTKYLLDTQNINDTFYMNMAAKTNKSKEEIEKTFDIFKRLQSKSLVTKEELVDLESIIESFKND